MNWPFEDTVKHKCTSIKSVGFSLPVPGCVYSGSRLQSGIPLGALGTGYFTLEGSGKIGYCSIYNDIVPPRRDFKEWLTVRVGSTNLPLSTAEISYWGHYPIADLIARFKRKPLILGIRAFTPFVLGNSKDSNIPAAMFEIELNNRGTKPMDVELIVEPPSINGKQRIHPVQNKLLGRRLKVITRAGGLRGVIPVAIPANKSKRVRFVFSWYAPNWRDSGYELHIHRYGLRYKNATAVAEDAMSRFDTLLARTLAWQGEIYHTPELPEWLRDWLVQSLYSLAKNTIWIAKSRYDEWWDAENGWFTHNESHTGCPITETIVCRIHGHFPALFFFPELEKTTLEAFRHFQISDGEIPFSFGLGTAMRDPRYHCQHPLNSGYYAQMVYRLYLRTQDRELLSDFYESAKRAIRYQFSLDDDGDGLVNEQAHILPGEYWPANQFYDIWPWRGTSAYVGGIWLSSLAIARTMAKIMRDKGFVSECDKWLRRARRAYYRKLWTGKYFRLWNDTQNNRCCNVSLANQLMGQCCAKIAGLGDILEEEKVQSALNIIERLNMSATSHGLVNGVTPQGKRFDTGFPGKNDHGKHIFVGENLYAAMTFMYYNRQDTGLEIAYRLYKAIFLKSSSPWNQSCLINSSTGLPVWGDDYYSNMAIWALPMALKRENISEFTEDGKLVSRILKSACNPTKT